jgi:tetratricopeptide (TPR) repeat protein
MTSLRRNRTLTPSNGKDSCLDNKDDSNNNNNSSKKKQPRSSFLSRFLSPRSSSKSHRTSTLSLTSIDDSVDVVNVHVAGDAKGNSAHSCSPTLVVRKNGPPLEVNMFQEQEFRHDDDDDDDDDEWSVNSFAGDDNGDDCGLGNSVWHYEKACAYAESQHFSKCLEHVDLGLHEQTETDALYWTLTELQAQVWGRMGCFRKSLNAYQGILAYSESQQQSCTASSGTASATNTPTDQANLLYTCGKLSVSLNEFVAALDYYRRELELTVRTVPHTDTNGSSCHYTNNLAVARIYHEMARVSKQGLRDAEQALGYYQEALTVEMSVWKNLKAKITGSCLCCSGGRNKKCATLTARLQEVQHQIQDTKRCMGRIHFEQGDIDQALRLSL